LLDEADHNIRIVEVGKSVHNIQFADKLLVAAYNILKKSLAVVGASANLPEFKSSSEFIPNECYSCHSGIQEINVKKFGLNFSHNLHIVKEKVICAKCHSNTQKHGELIVTKEGCNNCHHAENKTNDGCVNCHSFQNEVFEGKFGGKNQPDFMKQGGVKCTDCHVETDKVVKPESKVCLKCHDAGYEEQYSDWKKDVNKQVSELNSLIDKTKSMQLSNEDRDAVNDAKKLTSQIGSNPSIFVHNYDLISTLLSENIKKLKSFK
jgi:hypothetical protein